MVDLNKVRLEDVGSLKEGLDRLEKELEVNGSFWVLWKFYAQHETWFNDFIYKSGLEIPDEELRGRQVTKQDRYQGIDKTDFVTFEDGVRIWEERLLLREKIRETREVLCGCLVDARKHGVSMSAIAGVWGMTVNGVYKFFGRNGLLGE